MLSAFQARPAVELKARDKSKIESVLSYGDRLLVGLNTGSLRVYRTKEADQSAPADGSDAAAADAPQPRNIDLMREEDKFSKKPVQQLAVIKEANLLVALSDGYVSLHDLHSYALNERLEKTKGATQFAVISEVFRDQDTEIPSIVSKLAVAAKRKVFLWSWRDMESSDAVQEITLPAAVKLISWVNASTLLAGLDPGFSLINLETGEVSDINRNADSNDPKDTAQSIRFGAVTSSGMGYMGMGGWVPKPMATRLADNQMMLAKDVNTLFIDQLGKPLEKRQVPWIAPPDAIGYSYPYLLSLSQTSKGVLEVRNPDTLSLLQQIKLQDATMLHVPQPNISLAHAGKGFLVASERCIWRMSAIGYASQIQDLVTKSLYDEALSFVSQLEDTLIDDKEGRLRDIKIQKAQWWFDQRKYRDALDLFSDAEAPPARVISLYPPFLAGELSRWPSDDTPPTELGDSKDDDAASTKDTASSKGSIRGVPKEVKNAKDSDTASIVSGKGKPAQANGAKEGDAASKPLMEEKELRFATGELRGFLAQARVRIQPHLNYDGSLKDQATADQTRPPYFKLIAQAPDDVDDWRQALLDMAKLVDTSLFRVYMYASPSLAGSLFRLDNFCDPLVVEEKLYETARYQDLISFLQGKKLHRPALELLEKFGRGKEDPHDDSVDESLRGQKRTVSYLQQLPFEYIDLILEFAEWPVRTDPELGMQIFLADTETAENLPRERVLAFLEGIYPSLAEQYLEHIIDELSDLSPEFHDRRISLYLSRLGSSPESSTAPLTKEKLEQFLKESSSYSPEKVLPRLPASQRVFHESRATVLSRLHRHRDALQVYVFDLEDPSKAETYCNAIFSSSETTTTSPSSSGALDPDDPSQPSSIYTTLLGLYLSPPPGQKANLEAALDLLSHHGSRLPALSTLSLLPTTLPIQDLESYFRFRMRAAQSLAREEAVVRALASVEKASVDAQLLVGDEEVDPVTDGVVRPPGDSIKRGKNRRILIGEHKLCSICNKRFQRSLIRVYPDGRVAHYGCAGRGAPGGGTRNW